MPEPTRDQLLGALRKADAAGDTEAAKAIARRIQSMDTAADPDGGLDGVQVTDDRPSTLEQLGQATQSAVVGAAQGVAAIPDTLSFVADGVSDAINFGLTEGGAALADLAGFDGAADNLRQTGQEIRSKSQPVQIANALEQLSPTPEGMEASRFGAQLLGGFAVPFGPKAAPRTPVTAPAQRGVQQAADSLNVKTVPAVTGGTATRRITAGARQGFISDRPITRAVNEMTEQAGRARDDIASGVGDVVDSADAGELVRRGAEVFSKRTSQIGGKLYERADRFAEGVSLPLPKAMQAIDDELAQIARAPGGKESSLFQSLQKLRSQVADGKFPVDGIRQFRTTLRNELTERGLRGSPQDAAYQRVLKAAEDDMITGLREAGNDKAAAALRTASDFWKKRVETIDEVLEPVLGKRTMKSGEQIVTAVERLANPKSGNANRLRRLFQAMPADEAASVKATIVSRMGRPTAGAAEVADDAGFSFNTFLTNYNNMSAPARSTLFPKESRALLDDMARLSKEVKASGAVANTSNTAGALTVQALVSGGLWYAEPILMIAGAGGQVAVGKLLASPKFARILAGVGAQKTPQATQALSKRVMALAKTSPVIARELGQFNTALTRSANDNLRIGATAAAAEEPTR